MQNRKVDTGQHAKKMKNERKNGGAERCGETRGGEELMLTEERMIKCSPKGANALTAGWRDSAVTYMHMTSQMDGG